MISLDSVVETNTWALISFQLHFWLILAQSICNLYFSFEKRGRFADLKKTGSKIWGAKTKKQGQCYLEREKVRLSLLFLNNNDPAFCTPYFGPSFFQVRKPALFFKTKIVGDCVLRWSLNSLLVFMHPQVWWGYSTYFIQ